MDGGSMDSGSGETATARRIAFGDLPFLPRFAYGDQAEIAVVTGAEDGTPLGTGFARFHQAAIPWTVRYDEVLLVLDGSVTVETGEAALKLGPLDSAWLPKGSELTYRAQDALVFYAIHPSNWAERDAETGA